MYVLNKRKKKKWPFTNCTSLVPYGTNLGSTINMGRLAVNIRKLVSLPYDIDSIVVGILLSDGWLEKEKENVTANTRFRFKQAFSRADYVIHLFLVLAHYCSSLPSLVIGKINGTITTGLQISTRRYPCFNELYNLFYNNNIKVIPYNIYDLLTPIALAHWIMGDGAKLNKGLVLCTDSFSISDVIRLSNVLRIKYGLETSIIGLKSNKPRIYILAESMPNLIKIVKPYILKSFGYKLHLDANI